MKKFQAKLVVSMGGGINEEINLTEDQVVNLEVATRLRWEAAEDNGYSNEARLWRLLNQKCQKVRDLLGV